MTPRGARTATRLAAVVCAVLCVAPAGCIRRKLTVYSNPPGAILFMNDKRRGPTPHAYDFEWYGWYRLTLVKRGYERLDDHVLIKAPWYFWIPCDLVAELMPFPIRDFKELHYELKPEQGLAEPTPPDVGTTDTPKPTGGGST